MPKQSNTLKQHMLAYKDKTNITMVQQAKDMGLPYATMLYYFKEKSQPSVRRALKIADYLGVDVRDIWQPEE